MVAKDFGIPESDLFIRERTVRITEPRHMAIHLLHESGLSICHIGVIFGHFHPGTISNTLKAVKNRLETEPRYRARVQRIKEASAN